MIYHVENFLVLFDDLLALLDTQILEIEYNYRIHMVLLKLINDIGHSEYIRCSCQILASTNNNWV